MRQSESIVLLHEVMGSAECAGCLSEESVSEAELVLSVSFPPSYRDFLLNFGAAEVGFYRIAGIAAEQAMLTPPRWLNVVTHSNQLRRSFGDLLPRGHIAISDDGGENKFFLDTSTSNSEGECPVVVLGPGRDGVIVAPDFAHFVAMCADDSFDF